MSSFIITLTSLFNHFLIKSIDLGDKIYDNSFITIATILFTSIIAYLTDIFCKENGNWLLYKLWYRHKDPFQFKTEWYRHDTSETIRKSYINIELNQHVEIRNYIEKMIAKHNNVEIYTNDKYASFIIEENTNVPRQKYETAIIPLFYKGKGIVYYYRPKTVEYRALIAKNIDSAKDALGHITTMIQIDNHQSSSDLKIFEYASPETYKCIGKISKNKTMDKIFYDQKDNLMALVNKFKEGAMYPPTIGIDNKLGILLYGPPGTGKTGTILGLANYLQRNILMVNFGKINKKSELDFILNASKLSEYIFVFDEFDCILDVLTNKKDPQPIQEEKEKEMDWSKVLAVSNEEERKEILKMMRESLAKKEQSETIDLGYLLSKLDGLEDCNGRIIIATTNHPENINPALLRPGRFDLKLCLENCSERMYYDILKSYYVGVDTDVLQKEIQRIPVKRWSPLEIYNRCLIYSDPFDLINSLL